MAQMLFWCLGFICLFVCLLGLAHSTLSFLGQAEGENPFKIQEMGQLHVLPLDCKGSVL